MPKSYIMMVIEIISSAVSSGRYFAGAPFLRTLWPYEKSPGAWPGLSVFVDDLPRSKWD